MLFPSVVRFPLAARCAGVASKAHELRVLGHELPQYAVTVPGSPGRRASG